MDHLLVHGADSFLIISLLHDYFVVGTEWWYSSTSSCISDIERDFLLNALCSTWRITIFNFTFLLLICPRPKSRKRTRLVFKGCPPWTRSLRWSYFRFRSRFPGFPRNRRAPLWRDWICAKWARRAIGGFSEATSLGSQPRPRPEGD